jgi:hypothetical protein
MFDDVYAQAKHDYIRRFLDVTLLLGWSLFYSMLACPWTIWLFTGAAGREGRDRFASTYPRPARVLGFVIDRALMAGFAPVLVVYAAITAVVGLLRWLVACAGYGANLGATRFVGALARRGGLESALTIGGVALFTIGNAAQFAAA